MASFWPNPSVIIVAGALPMAMVALLVCFAVRVLPRRTRRRHVTCPIHEREAIVDFVTDEDGGTVFADVVACSLVPGRREVACGKPCRSTGVAPFGTAHTS
jgi:hypothetical protein